MSLPAPDLQIYLPDETAATRFAEICALHLKAGDTVLLSGPIGAGKSHFARAVIRTHLGAQTEVPSPTFTLVQTYNAFDFEIWHADLYRLTNSAELAELGLDDAMGTALCLIEWPDRMGEIPKGCISMALALADEGRIVTIGGARASFTAALREVFT
jgi:tRNA threonylcarbamoyladenosine biosynthesis protein TsaE